MSSARERRAQRIALLESRSEETHRALRELPRLVSSSSDPERPLGVTALFLDRSYHHVLSEIREDRRRIDQLPRGVVPPKGE